MTRLRGGCASRLSEQQTIADTFFAEGLFPRRIDTSGAKIWQATTTQ